MKLKQQYVLIALAVVLTLAAFSAGTFAGLAAGRGRLLETIARVAQVTSGAFEHHQDLDVPGVTNLNALEVIWEVREKVKQQFVYPVKDDNKLTYGAIRGMLSSLDDPYTRFLDPEEFKEFRTDTSGHFDGIGAVLESKADDKGHEQVVISSILEEGPAAKTNLRPKDIIVKVDKTIVDGMSLTAVVKLIRGPRGTKVTLTIKRSDVPEPFDVEIVRKVITSPIVESKMEDESSKIGYIALRQFNEKSDQLFDKAMTDLESQGMRALVLDLRGNPGGLLDVAIEIGSRLIPEGDIVVIQDKGGRLSRYGVEPSKQNHRMYPLTVLIDGSSASASEIIAGAIQDNKAGTLVGTDSFGKGKVQTIMSLPGGSAVVITTAKYFTPSMRDVDKLKIHPDVVVEPSDEDIKNDVDVQLNKAVEILRTRLGANKAVAGNRADEKS